MIILYVPFNEETDLLGMAMRWRDQINAESQGNEDTLSGLMDAQDEEETLPDLMEQSDEETKLIAKPNKTVVIIQYGDEEDTLPEVPPEDDELIVYVLGHTTTDSKFSLYVLSHSVFEKAVKLHISEIATRFKNDLLYYKPHIKKIKLYFCEEQQNMNREIAQKFKAEIESYENIRLDYYHGEIELPNYKQGETSIHKHAYFENNIRKRASQSRESLFLEEKKLNEGKMRVNIKKKTEEDRRDKNQFKINRMDKLNKKTKEARQNSVNAKRRK